MNTLPTLGFAAVAVLLSGCTRSQGLPVAPPAEEASTAPNAVVATSPPTPDEQPASVAQPNPEQSAAKLHLLASVPLGSLVRGRDRVSYLEDGWDAEVVYRVGASGLERLPEISKQLSKRPCSDRVTATCAFAEGHTFVRVRGAPNRARATRLTPRGSSSIAVGDFFGAVALHDEIEAWLVADEQISRLAFIDARDRLRRVKAPATLGPRVEGLTRLARRACARPSHWKIAPYDRGVVALVVECNLDAPLRAQRYGHDGDLIEEVTLPSLSEQGVRPADFTALADGRAVVIGRGDKAEWAVERPDRTWDVHEGAGPARDSVYDALVSADGAVWFISWGRLDPQTAVRQIQRNGVPVELPAVDGDALSPLQLAFDATLGVVALAIVDGAADSYLMVENEHAVLSPPSIHQTPEAQD